MESFVFLVGRLPDFFFGFLVVLEFFVLLVLAFDCVFGVLCWSRIEIISYNSTCMIISQRRTLSIFWLSQ